MQWIFVLCGCMFLLSLIATYQVCTVSLKAGLYTYNGSGADGRTASARTSLPPFPAAHRQRWACITGLLPVLSTYGPENILAQKEVRSWPVPMSSPLLTPARSRRGSEDGRHRARGQVPPATIAPLGYLTPQDAFGDVERGNPLPYTLPPERRRAVGLERETWRLEVVADPESDTRLERPL